MKKIKRVCAFAIVLFCFHISAISLFAAEYTGFQDYCDEISENRQIYDFAGLMDEESRNRLEQEIKKASDAAKLDLVVVLIDENFSYHPGTFADDFYDAGWFGYEDNIRNGSGALLLLDMDAREVYISTAGIGILYLNDTVYNLILDDIMENVKNQEYVEMCEEFIEDCVYFSNMAATTEAYQKVIQAWYSGKYQDYADLERAYPEEFEEFEYLVFDHDAEGIVSEDKEIDVYNYHYQGLKEVTFFTLFRSVFINLVIGAVIALIFVIVQSIHQKSKITVSGQDYCSNEGYQFRERKDIFLRRTTVKRKIETSSGGGSGNGGGGSHHSSSSGASHGGGGRSF